MTTVLILTNSTDGSHTEVVMQKIEELGSTVIRLNTDEVTSGESTLERTINGSIELHTIDRCHDLVSVDSIWLRRPRVFKFNVDDEVQRIHTENEFMSFLSGIYSLLEDRCWINTPWAMEKAKLKVYQLEIAKEVGLNIPNTIVTNNPDSARHFASLGPTIFKPLSEPNISNGTKMLVIPTTLLTEKHLENIELIRNQYILLQSYIEKVYELRVTFVAGDIFVAKQVPADSAKAQIADWRLLQVSQGSNYVPSSIDETLSNQIVALMNRLDLRFATIDIIVDSEGRHYFLEVNPNGQWYGYTDEIGIPASFSIAKLLVDAYKRG